MSDWWTGRTLDSLDGVRVNVFDQGRRYGGCLQRRGDHLTLIDTCMAFTVFCQDGQGKVKPVFPLPDIREAPGDPFWQGRFLDELEGVTVTAVLHDGRRLRGVLSRRDDTLTLGRDNTVVFAGDMHGFAILDGRVGDISWRPTHNGLHAIRQRIAFHYVRRGDDIVSGTLTPDSLKGCPCCGSNLVRLIVPDDLDSEPDDYESGVWRVSCWDCGTSTPGKPVTGQGRGAAIRAALSAVRGWNRRA